MITGLLIYIIIGIAFGIFAEFKMKDEYIRASILKTEEDVKEIKDDIKYLREKMDNLK